MRCRRRGPTETFYSVGEELHNGLFISYVALHDEAIFWFRALGFCFLQLVSASGEKYERPASFRQRNGRSAADTCVAQSSQRHNNTQTKLFSITGRCSSDHRYFAFTRGRHVGRDATNGALRALNDSVSQVFTNLDRSPVKENTWYLWRSMGHSRAYVQVPVPHLSLPAHASGRIMGSELRRDERLWIISGIGSVRGHRGVQNVRHPALAGARSIQAASLTISRTFTLTPIQPLSLIVSCFTINNQAHITSATIYHNAIVDDDNHPTFSNTNDSPWRG